MDYIALYCQQVGECLPKAEREATLADLYEELQSQFEEEGGDEQAFIARQPEPLERARSYCDADALTLIGPRYYLSFMQALKVITSILVVLHLVLAGVAIINGENPIGAGIRQAFTFAGNWLLTSAVVIWIVASLEKHDKPIDWLMSSFSRSSPSRPGIQIDRGDAFFDLIMSILVLLAVTGGLQLPLLIAEDGTWLTGWEYNLPAIFWMGLIPLLLCDIALAAAKLWFRYWNLTLQIIGLTLNLVWIAVLAYVAEREPLLLLTDANLVSEQILAGVNTALPYVFYSVIAVLIWDCYRTLWPKQQPTPKVTG